MNIGFYLETSGGTPENLEIYNLLNKGVENGELKDASVFFNSVNFNPVTPKFGMFDATELWHFTGNLVATSLVNTIKAKSVVNKLRLAYLFSARDKKEQNILKMVEISKDVKVLAKGEADGNEFYRLTGTRPTVIDKLDLNTIQGIFDE